MKKFLLISLTIPFLFSCESLKNTSVKVIKGASGSCFEVPLYSGGKKVFTDYANYVNTEEKSDGFYFEKHGRQIY